MYNTQQQQSHVDYQQANTQTQAADESQTDIDMIEDDIDVETGRFVLIVRWNRGLLCTDQHTAFKNIDPIIMPTLLIENGPRRLTGAEPMPSSWKTNESLVVHDTSFRPGLIAPESVAKAKHERRSLLSIDDTREAVRAMEVLLAASRLYIRAQWVSIFRRAPTSGKEVDGFLGGHRWHSSNSSVTLNFLRVAVVSYV